MDMEPIVNLVNKPYVNGVILREQNLSQKSCQSYELEVCFKAVLDLSKELKLLKSTF